MQSLVAALGDDDAQALTDHRSTPTLALVGYCVAVPGLSFWEYDQPCSLPAAARPCAQPAEDDIGVRAAGHAGHPASERRHNEVSEFQSRQRLSFASEVERDDAPPSDLERSVTLLAVDGCSNARQRAQSGGQRWQALLQSGKSRSGIE